MFSINVLLVVKSSLPVYEFAPVEIPAVLTGTLAVEIPAVELLPVKPEVYL